MVGYLTIRSTRTGLWKVLANDTNNDFCHHYHPQETKSSDYKYLKGHYVRGKKSQLSMTTVNKKQGADAAEAKFPTVQSGLCGSGNTEFLVPESDQIQAGKPFF